jgi:hypothetical protein
MRASERSDHKLIIITISGIALTRKTFFVDSAAASAMRDEANGFIGWNDGIGHARGDNSAQSRARDTNSRIRINFNFSFR